MWLKSLKKASKWTLTHFTISNIKNELSRSNYLMFEPKEANGDQNNVQFSFLDKKNIVR